MNIILLITGLVFIYCGGKLLMDNSIEFARIFRWPGFIVGVIIMGFGTSLPEIAISTYSAATQHPGITVGNILGSNITNVFLILGISVLIKPCSKVLYRSWINICSLIAATLLFTYGLLADQFHWILGITMLLIIITGTVLMIKINKGSISGTHTPQHPLWWVLLKLLFGLLLLLVSSQCIIDSVVSLSRTLGISETLISITMIALGTSLPELILVVLAARKNHFDLIFGNIIGSNISNILLGIGIPASFISFTPGSSISRLDLTVFLGSTVTLLLLYLVGFLRKRSIGVICLTIYLAFMTLLIL